LADDRVDRAAPVPVTTIKRGAPEPQSAPAVEKEQLQKAIKSLLAAADQTVDDKLATVKTAHHVDKDRFQSAFRSLMRK